MKVRNFVIAALGAAAISIALSAEAQQLPPVEGKCNTVPQRCAVAVGGWCNSTTGEWRYTGRQTPMFNECVHSNQQRSSR